MKSLSSEDKNVNMSDIDSGSLLGSAATTPKAKQVNTGAVFSSPLGCLNFYMDDDKVVLPLCLPISFDKKWIDPKIIKTPVKMSIKKLFALDINLSAVEDKSATARTQLIRKIFSSSMEMAVSLAKEKEININSDLKKQEMRSD
ncbi:hypothetical protein G9A89_015332 [Geosiphon pyriformis]|nr:hypothetical protein G9A89_015332 [Geosiphon pyriformis]